VLIAINDAYADGRDLSWLWDVDFSALRKRGVSVVSGVRAAEMALRLRYDLVDVDTVEPDFAKALAHVLNDNPGLPVRIFATYTAMLRLRRELRQYTTVSRMGE
jgi:UDP-N-acetylmuramyl tripeptide synthase